MSCLNECFQKIEGAYSQHIHTQKNAKTLRNANHIPLGQRRLRTRWPPSPSCAASRRPQEECGASVSLSVESSLHLQDQEKAVPTRQRPQSHWTSSFSAWPAGLLSSSSSLRASDYPAAWGEESNQIQEVTTTYTCAVAVAVAFVKGKRLENT